MKRRLAILLVALATLAPATVLAKRVSQAKQMADVVQSLNRRQGTRLYRPWSSAKVALGKRVDGTWRRFRADTHPGLSPSRRATVRRRATVDGRVRMTDAKGTG